MPRDVYLKLLKQDADQWQRTDMGRRRLLKDFDEVIVYRS